MKATLLATYNSISCYPHNNFLNVLLFSFRNDKTGSKKKKQKKKHISVDQCHIVTKYVE